jgi:hypothetical protein
VARTFAEAVGSATIIFPPSRGSLQNI